MGLNLRQTRLIIVIGCQPAQRQPPSPPAGIIGFIGLIAPHLARNLVGAKHSILIPTSMLIGALLAALLSDALARTLMAPIEPAGWHFHSPAGRPILPLSAAQRTKNIMIVLRADKLNLGYKRDLCRLKT